MPRLPSGPSRATEREAGGLRGRTTEILAWVLALAAGWAALAVVGYGARDADSRLYAEMAARMSTASPSEWIAPDFPPGWYMSGLYREHPVGIFVPAALLARAGYPAEQAAYAMNALYQVLTILLVQRLAFALVPGLEGRALGWLIQLLPIAFTFRIRANQEQAVVLLLLVALLGTERARQRPRWALLIVLGLVGLVLVKGVLAVFGPVLCALWLLVRRWTAGPGSSERAAWGGLAVAALAMAGTALAYEHAYRAATGESFLAVYLGRQLGAAAVAQSEAGLAQKLYNVVWYLGRVIWFPFPWSLTLIAATWTALRARRGGAPSSGGRGGGPGGGFLRGGSRGPLRGALQPLRSTRRPLHLPRLLRDGGGRGGGRAPGVATLPSARSEARPAGCAGGGVVGDVPAPPVRRTSGRADDQALGTGLLARILHQAFCCDEVWRIIRASRDDGG